MANISGRIFFCQYPINCLDDGLGKFDLENFQFISEVIEEIRFGFTNPKR